MKFYIILCLLLITVLSDLEVKKYKFRMMFPDTSPIPNPTDKKTEYTYKNIHLTETEIQVYLSPSEGNEVYTI
jgi:hypothetical protein